MNTKYISRKGAKEKKKSKGKCSTLCFTRRSIYFYLTLTEKGEGGAVMYLNDDKSVIDIFSMAYINHKDSKNIILNSINDSVIS